MLTLAKSTAARVAKPACETNAKEHRTADAAGNPKAVIHNLVAIGMGRVEVTEVRIVLFTHFGSLTDPLPRSPL